MALDLRQRLRQPVRCRVHDSYTCSCTETMEPWFGRRIFGDIRIAWVWLILRVWLGWQWLEAGRHKISSPAWMETGVALRGFWERAVAVPEEGRPAVAYSWYRSFLETLLDGGHYTWFAKLVAIGELLIGIALILGLLTGIAAFFGVFMNWHFVMAGAASTNAMLALVGILLVLAWRIAGWWGLDRWLLPWLGLQRTPPALVGSSPRRGDEMGDPPPDDRV